MWLDAAKVNRSFGITTFESQVLPRVQKRQFYWLHFPIVHGSLLSRCDSLKKEQIVKNYRDIYHAFASLKSLLADDINGNWTLSLTDSERGVSGELLDWGFGFNESPYSRNAEYIPQPIPEPRNSRNADARLSPDGRLALSW